MPAIDITIPAELVELFQPAFLAWKTETGSTDTVEQWCNKAIAAATLPLLEKYQIWQVEDIINNL